MKKNQIVSFIAEIEVLSYLEKTPTPVWWYYMYSTFTGRLEPEDGVHLPQ